jgi:hypothetical protein
MYLVAFSSRLDASCGVDSVSKELESGLVTSQNSRRDRSTVESNANGQVTRVGAERSFKLANEFVESLHAISRKPRHGQSMVFASFRQSSYSHIAISNRLNLKHTSAFSHDVKGTIDSFQQRKDLRGLAD